MTNLIRSRYMFFAILIGSCIVHCRTQADSSTTENEKSILSSINTKNHGDLHTLSDSNHDEMMKHHGLMKEHNMDSIHAGHDNHDSTATKMTEQQPSSDGISSHNHSTVYTDHSKHVLVLDQPVIIDHALHKASDHYHDHDMDHNKDHDMDHNKDHDKEHDKDHDKESGMHMNHSGMHMMMYFHVGVEETVLFKEWKITTVGGMIGSMIGIFLLGMFYEGLKYFREYLFKQYVSSIQFSTVAVTGESGRVNQVHKVERHRMLSWPHALQTTLHIVQMVMSYFLMLIFMTYNVWLCIAVILGAGAGYFVFGWKKASVVDITEHCH